MKTIGWIGLGNMGNPMAENLLKAGYKINIYQRVPNKISPLVEKGAVAIQDLATFLKESDIVFLTLPNDTIVEDTFNQILTCELTGKTFVNSSTISPALAARLYQKVQGKAAFYLDAPVSGSVKPAVDGSLVFLIGGDSTDITTCEPLFRIMGKSHYHIGAAGSGSKAKLAINYYMSIVVQGLAETVRFAQDNGISAEDMTAIVNDSACGSGMSKIKTPNIINNEYPAAFPLKFMLKDIRLAKEQGWNTPMLLAAEQAYAKASEQGLAEQDLMAVINAIK